MTNLTLNQQLCFPVYAASRLITQSYTKYLQTLDLTYPQYLVLLVLREQDNRSIQEIGSMLLLQSNTLTPLLKRMEKKHLIQRHTDTKDHRIKNICLTSQGKQLQKKAQHIPENILCSMLPQHTPKEDLLQCKKTLQDIITHLTQS